ncbi:hypothetical protein [Vibrio breoganii]|uniref:hypothetical protein n=1 Tax=Vibrio breoganii TaxID=553239 RepID=UPI00030C0DD0|nr:hypothetical protein [Vibrio breoganii]OED96330.1 capsular biosynthesis protein [Vibrio breoganii ZF-29]TKG21069.1 capsular biosynthesis protein [Vibrio breoganii]
MFLIMSGAYVGPELESEFGKLPPSFLPLGNKRLFQHQVALAPTGADVFLSIPDSFELSTVDRELLSKQNVTVLQVPENLSLGASLVTAINMSGHRLDRSLHVLYGDTLYGKLPVGDDIVSVSTSKSNYSWAVLTEDNLNWIQKNQPELSISSEKIIDGYYKFSNPRELIKCITQKNWDILEGLNLYHNSIGLTGVTSSNWLDFGHVNTYYHSKAQYTTQRAFNELSINSKWIEKSSVKSDKITAEADWFEKLPSKLKGYTPQYLGSSRTNGKVSYRLEYLHLTALNELFVFGKLTSRVWSRIFLNCVEFLQSCKEFQNESSETSNDLNSLFSKKTNNRLAEYCKNYNIDPERRWKFNDNESVSLSELMAKSESHLPPYEGKQTVLHGDFCFSNILYDFRAGKIKTIDPRGMTPEGKSTIYGDIRYDIAKLSHSVLGMYDWIIAGYYKVHISDYEINFTLEQNNQLKETQRSFIEIIESEFQITTLNLYAMQIQLFLSMLPLHADDPVRQKALLANAFRLYHIFQRLEQ